MTEQKQSSRIGLYFTLGITLAIPIVVAILVVGAETMRQIAVWSVAGVLLIGLIIASAFPIRAWKRRDATGLVEHYYHDGTRTIEREKVLDGRTVEAPRLLQLPAQPQSAGFPELLRAAWQAGHTAAQQPGLPYDAQPIEPRTLTPLDPSAPAGWYGEIH